MRALGAQLLKGDRLARLVGEARSSPRVSKQMIQTVAQHYRQHVKDDLTIAGRTELLELPAAAFHLLVVLLNLRTLFVVTHDPRRAQLLISCHQDDMVGSLFLRMPKANHTGVQGHLTLWPHMFHATHPGNTLLSPGGMRVPFVCHLGELNGLLCRQHVGFEWYDHIDL